jgi:hypothetical protein
MPRSNKSTGAQAATHTGASTIPKPAGKKSMTEKLRAAMPGWTLQRLRRFAIQKDFFHRQVKGRLSSLNHKYMRLQAMYSSLYEQNLRLEEELRKARGENDSESESSSEE